MNRFIQKAIGLVIGVFFSQLGLAQEQNDPQTMWGKSIAHFDSLDAAATPETGGVLFLGSSSFTIWKDVNDYFPGKHIINRGFGGSQTSDILYFKERLILPYNPSHIVVYIGENDVAAGESPESVRDEWEQLISWTRKHVPGVRFSFLSIKPSPSRWALKDNMERANRLLAKFASENEDVDYINIWDAMLDDRGVPRRDIYLGDSLHMNKRGYQIWQKAIAPYLDATPPPNYVVIFCDDLGWGDLGIYGHPTIRTPHLDRLASEGQKWTNFYAAAPVCTPSRAGILTGRLPIRSGMASDQHRVLFPESKGGLPESEITLAQQLKAHGYRTACIGKWHLGHQERFMPYNRGFDYFYGLKYSNDMDRDPAIPYMEACEHPELEYFQLELMRNREVIEQPAYQPDLTKNYTAEAVQFIERNRHQPFFLYLAHAMPHVPLYRSDAFADTSRRGKYGDVIEELDWSVGKIVEAIEANGLRQHTVVVFTSDNGPWLTFKTHGGSAGLLRDGKGSTYEGGMRVPGIFWAPGMVKPHVVMEIGSTLDLFATFCSLSGIPMPADRVYDSYDLSPVLTGHSDTAARTEIFYYRDTRIFAVRKGKFKAHFATKSGYGPDPEVSHQIPLLYDLEADPAEQFDVAAAHPEVISELRRLVEQHQATVVPVMNQLNLY